MRAGEAVSMIVIVGFVVLIPITLMSWGLYFRPKWDGLKWDAACRALGMTLGPPVAGGFELWRGPSVRQPMLGHRGGAQVRCAMRYVVHGSGKNRRVVYFTFVDVVLPSPLQLGLAVAPAKTSTGNVLGDFLSNLMGAAFKPQDLQLGHPQIDAAYDIRAGAPELAVRVLSSPGVAEMLFRLSQAPFRPQINDAVVRLETWGKVFAPHELSAALDAAVHLAQQLHAARAASQQQHGPQMWA
jgi:hypothetical protein